jgi:hypothetical protein
VADDGEKADLGTGAIDFLGDAAGAFGVIDEIW